MDILSFDCPLRHSCAGRNLNAEQDNLALVWRFRIADRVGNDDTISSSGFVIPSQIKVNF